MNDGLKSKDTPGSLEGGLGLDTLGGAGIKEDTPLLEEKLALAGVKFCLDPLETGGIGTRDEDEDAGGGVNTGPRSVLVLALAGEEDERLAITC